MTGRHRTTVEPTGWQLAAWTILGSAPFWASFALWLVIS